jgi:hypothetical protein
MTAQHNAKILKFKQFVIAAKKGCGQTGNMAEAHPHVMYHRSEIDSEDVKLIKIIIFGHDK